MANTRGATVTQVTPHVFRFGNLTGHKANLNDSVEVWNWKDTGGGGR